nr:hypothetical protein [uncultured Prevotella sp.]
MAGRSTISITFKLDGDGKGFRDLASDAEGFKKIMTSTISEAKKLNAKTINFAAIATGIDQCSQTVEAARSAVATLTEAWTVEKTAETQLNTVMRQRMNASSEDVKSVEELAESQQKLGVVGHEVQLSGAQQLATFLKHKSSLQELIPAMNNLIAQQKGMNASTEDAVTIANMMGKAMTGQSSSLKRVGISFNEEEASMLKYGNESQRAAVLARIITANVGNMNAELAKTNPGKQKRLENTIEDLKQKLGHLVEGAEPFLAISADAAIALMGIIKLISGVKAASAAIGAWNIKTHLAGLGMAALGLKTSQTTAVVRVFSAALTTGAYSATAMKIALRGLMVATGIGIAIAMVTSAVEALSTAFNKSTDDEEHISNAEKRAKDEAEQNTEAKNSEREALENTRAELELNIQRLKDFHGTKVQEKKIVTEMNNTYGQTLGYFSSVADWYQALTRDSKAYCDQMVTEARTRMIANQIAQKEQDLHDIYYNEDGSKKKYSKQNKQIVAVNTGSGITHDVKFVEKSGSSDFDKANKRAKDTVKSIVSGRKQLNSLVRQSSKTHMPIKGSSSMPDLNKSKHHKRKISKEEETEYQKLGKLIDAYKEKYIHASNAEKQKIRESISILTKKREDIELLYKQAERPISLKSLEDVDAEISYQEELKKSAKQSNLAGIDSEIKRLNDLKKSMEDSGHIEIPIDSIKTYKELNDELSFYSDKLQTTSGIQRDFIQEHINGLNQLKDKWDNTLSMLKKPADISMLDTIQKLDEAISYYQQLQDSESADEIQNTQNVINKLNAKKAAMQRGMDILSAQEEVNDINSLPDKEQKIKIKAIGVDELQNRVWNLKKILGDTKNPVTGKQRKDIEGLIGIYDVWRAKASKSFATYRAGWEGIKGIGDSVESISDALKGNADAWQRITAVVEGFLQIFDGISEVKKIIDDITAANKLLTKSTKLESVADMKAAGAKGTKAIASGTAAVASGTEAAASGTAAAAAGTEAAADATAAGAKVMKAHAAIPWVGIAIGAGLTAIMVATIASIKGSMPKFAKGGLVYGPTIAQMGEYPGASNNPEVIAPLNKLKGMLQPQQGGIYGVQFRISGRDLVGVIANETRINAISGGRSNIK